MLINLVKIIISLFFVILIPSCASFKSGTSLENKTILKKENLYVLNGTYKINENERFLPLDCFLSKEEFYATNKYVSIHRKLVKEKEPVFITLKVLNKKKIKAVIKVNDSVLKSFNIKGKIKNGFFEQNRKIYILPALLINSFQTSKFRIGFYDEGDISIDFKRINFGTVYFFSPYYNNKSYVNTIHNRLDNY